MLETRRRQMQRLEKSIHSADLSREKRIPENCCEDRFFAFFRFFYSISLLSNGTFLVCRFLVLYDTVRPTPQPQKKKTCPRKRAAAVSFILNSSSIRPHNQVEMYLLVKSRYKKLKLLLRALSLSV